jgi:hypothetical protein
MLRLGTTTRYRLASGSNGPTRAFSVPMLGMRTAGCYDANKSRAEGPDPEAIHEVRLGPDQFRPGTLELAVKKRQTWHRLPHNQQELAHFSENAPIAIHEGEP